MTHVTKNGTPCRSLDVSGGSLHQICEPLRTAPANFAVPYRHVEQALRHALELYLVVVRWPSHEMGLLDCCCAPWRQVAPAPEDNAPTSSTVIRTRATRNSELVENGMMLVELLSPAQQEELASAFRQFDVDGSGAMYAAQLPRSLTGPTRPHALTPAWVAVRVCTVTAER